MQNNKDVINFIKEYPEEFNELVNVFKNLMFSNNSENSEEKTLIESINILKDKYGLDEFVQNLVDLDLRKVLSILKKMVRVIEDKKREKYEKSRLIKENQNLIKNQFNNNSINSIKQNLTTKMNSLRNINISTDFDNKDLFDIKRGGNRGIYI